MSAARSVLTAFVLVALALPASALGHGEAEPTLVLPSHDLEPGRPVMVTGLDFAAGSRVAVEIVWSGGSFRVGEVVTDAAGHFSQTFTLPGNVPGGQAEMTAFGDDGSAAAVPVLVRAGESGSTAPPAGTGGWWADPSLLVSAVVLGAVALVVLYLLLRRRTTREARVAAAGRRPVPRKRKAAGPHRAP